MEMTTFLKESIEMNKMLITELAKKDINELTELVNGVPFEDAYNKLGGFNLEMSPAFIDKELIGIDIFFDFNFNSINGTIFRKPNGMCELGETWDVWIGDKIIAQVIGNEDDVDFVRFV